MRDESLGIKHATGEQFELAQCLEVLGSLALDGGDAELAAQLLGAASGVRTRIGARSRADEPGGDAAAEAVRRALGPTGPPRSRPRERGGRWNRLWRRHPRSGRARHGRRAPLRQRLRNASG